jgi:hypothetical protein
MVIEDTVNAEKDLPGIRIVDKDVHPSLAPHAVMMLSARRMKYVG